MADFSNLQSYEPEGASEYDVLDLQWSDGTYPTLSLLYAGESNKKYWSPFLRAAGRLAKRSRAARDVTPDQIAQAEKVDRELYPKYVCVGWKNMRDVHGAVIPYSRKECEEFFAQVPRWILEGIREHATGPGNYIDSMDVEEVSGNSDGGSDSTSATSATAG